MANAIKDMKPPERLRSRAPRMLQAQPIGVDTVCSKMNRVNVGKELTRCSEQNVVDLEKAAKIHTEPRAVSSNPHSIADVIDR
jgi:hypothetical protein